MRTIRCQRTHLLSRHWTLSSMHLHPSRGLGLRTSTRWLSICAHLAAEDIAAPPKAPRALIWSKLERPCHIRRPNRPTRLPCVKIATRGRFWSNHVRSLLRRRDRSHGMSADPPSAACAGTAHRLLAKRMPARPLAKRMPARPLTAAGSGTLSNLTSEREAARLEERLGQPL